MKGRSRSGTTSRPRDAANFMHGMDRSTCRSARRHSRLPARPALRRDRGRSGVLQSLRGAQRRDAEKPGLCQPRRRANALDTERREAFPLGRPLDMPRRLQPGPACRAASSRRCDTTCPRPASRRTARPCSGSSFPISGQARRRGRASACRRRRGQRCRHRRAKSAWCRQCRAALGSAAFEGWGDEADFIALAKAALSPAALDACFGSGPYSLGLYRHQITRTKTAWSAG